MLSGGPTRDGIPSIDNPHFIPTQKAAKWLTDNEPVIAFQMNGNARAHPLQILIWHEIVNDIVGGVPVLITFCPLCNSAIVFDRRLKGKVYEFGTSGLLRNSDLVMYDRTTESLWQQFTGEAIVWRVTLTPAVINAAANVIFIVSGKEKAERLRQVLTEPYQPEILPAQIIRPTAGRLLWLVDAVTASLLCE